MVADDLAALDRTGWFSHDRANGRFRREGVIEPVAQDGRLSTSRRPYAPAIKFYILAPRPCGWLGCDIDNSNKDKIALSFCVDDEDIDGSN
jgi:hypothetical protein